MPHIVAKSLNKSRTSTIREQDYLDHSLFDQLCSLSTTELFDAVRTIKDEQPVYSEEDKSKIKHKIEELHSDFNENIFDEKESFSKEQFAKRVSQEYSWIFDSSIVRSRLLKHAKIPEKHFLSQEQLARRAYESLRNE